MKDLEYSTAETSGSKEWLESIKDIKISPFIEWVLKEEEK